MQADLLDLLVCSPLDLVSTWVDRVNRRQRKLAGVRHEAFLILSVRWATNEANALDYAARNRATHEKNTHKAAHQFRDKKNGAHTDSVTLQRDANGIRLNCW